MVPFSVANFDFLTGRGFFNAPEGHSRGTVLGRTVFLGFGVEYVESSGLRGGFAEAPNSPSGSCVHTLGPKVGITCILGALQYGLEFN